MRITKQIRVYGIVQGVGFRPTVSRHALETGITGSVCNKGPYVEIFAQGEPEQVELISGPGCPVCVTQVGFIDEAVLLGLEPLYLACEGQLVVVAPREEAPRLLEVLRKGKYSQSAAIIGEITAENPGRVIMTTEIGAQTVLPQPGGELLPRIC